MLLLLRVKLQGNEWCIIIPHVTEFSTSQQNSLSHKQVYSPCPITVEEALSSGFLSEKLLLVGGRTAQNRFIYMRRMVIMTGSCIQISHVIPVQDLFW